MNNRNSIIIKSSLRLFCSKDPCQWHWKKAWKGEFEQWGWCKIKLTMALVRELFSILGIGIAFWGCGCRSKVRHKIANFSRVNENGNFTAAADVSIFLLAFFHLMRSLLLLIVRQSSSLALMDAIIDQVNWFFWRVRFPSKILHGFIIHKNCCVPFNAKKTVFLFSKTSNLLKVLLKDIYNSFNTLG